MPKITEFLTGKNQKALYGQISKLTRRINPDPNLPYAHFFEEINDAYVSLMGEELPTVEIIQVLHESMLVYNGLSWQVEWLFKELTLKNFTHLSDVLLPLLILDMEDVHITTNHLAYYIVSTSLVQLVPEYIKQQNITESLL